MSINKLKLQWAKRLLRAKYFVIMTDVGSAISFDGVNPTSTSDVMTLASQQAELKTFYQSIGGLIEQHDTAISKLTGASNDNQRKPARKPTTTKQSAKKGASK